jgi:hypothetical protein
MALERVLEQPWQAPSCTTNVVKKRVAERVLFDGANVTWGTNRVLSFESPRGEQRVFFVR